MGKKQQNNHKQIEAHKKDGSSKGSRCCKMHVDEKFKGFIFLEQDYPLNRISKSISRRRHINSHVFNFICSRLIKNNRLFRTLYFESTFR